jgi:hypothetical protein
MGGESSPSPRTFAKIRSHSSSRGDGGIVKQLNVFPMIVMLIIVLALVYWLRPQ